MIKHEKGMSDRRYIVNKKCLAVLRALGTGEHDPKWDYVYTDGKSIIATNCVKFMRITMPEQKDPPSAPRVFPKTEIEALLKKPMKSDTVVELGEGVEARSNGTFSVPSFEHAVPPPDKEVASITVTAKDLIDLLKSACEVTEHSRYLVRLRIMKVGKNPVVRIDAHRDEGEQEFVGCMMGTHYNGVNIPGDKPENAPPVSMQSETIDERKLELPLVEGRKFRKCLNSIQNTRSGLSA